MSDFRLSVIVSSRATTVNLEVLPENVHMKTPRKFNIHSS